MDLDKEFAQFWAIDSDCTSLVGSHESWELMKFRGEHSTAGPLLSLVELLGKSVGEMIDHGKHPSFCFLAASPRLALPERRDSEVKSLVLHVLSEMVPWKMNAHLLRKFETPALLSAASTSSLTAIRGLGLLRAAMAPFSSCSTLAFFLSLASLAWEIEPRSTSR